MRPTVKTLPFGQCTFIPAGCLHWPIGDRGQIQKWVRAVAEAENGFTILMGDTMDAGRTHFRKHIRGYTEDENSQLALDEWHKRDVRELAALLEPIKRKIIGAILGNHYWTYADGTNSEQYLCQLLDIPYLGPLGLIRLEFRDNGGRGRCRHHMILFAHHSGGTNGGRTTGGDVAALERNEGGFDADIYCLSHTHRRHGFKLPLVTLSSKGRPVLRERTKVFIRSGAFLKGFPEDNPSRTQAHFPSYAEMKALRPTDLGWVSLSIRLTNVNSHGASRRAAFDRGAAVDGIRSELTLSY